MDHNLWLPGTSLPLAEEGTASTRLVTFGTGVALRWIVRVRTWHGLMEVRETTGMDPLLILLIVFDNKILTSARNGEVILWDINKSGAAKYGRHFSVFASVLINLERRTKIQGSYPLNQRHVCFARCALLLYNWLGWWRHARVGEPSALICCASVTSHLIF